MTIREITIEGVRGIDKLEIKNDIYKNRPNILVAPNGFGKTSIASSFKCASDQTYLKIDDANRHQHISSNKSKLSVMLEEEGNTSIFEANEEAHSNDVRKNFDIHVVSDLRRIKAHTKNMGSFSKAEAKMVIDPIVICEKPPRVECPYKISEIKREFSNHKSLLPNISEALFNSDHFVMRSAEVLKQLDVCLRQLCVNLTPKS